jgi:uncharacterized protein YecA (UPF0149 family)
MLNFFRPLGSEKKPVRVTIDSDYAADRVEMLCEMMDVYSEVTVDPRAEEYMDEFFYVLDDYLEENPELADFLMQESKPLTNPQLKPNFFCPCDSGKKYKKCCMPLAPTANA